jgi:hypothetical protein
MVNFEKFKEMILYVAKQADKDDRCGKTKLNKLLFYADFEAYRRFGASISGQSYQKRQFGPVPVAFLPTVDAMVAERACAWARREYFDKQLEKLIALRNPDLSAFSGEEVDVMCSVVERLWDLNATEVSDLSHRFPGWMAAEIGEEIPYETAFVGDPRRLSPDETSWAEAVIAEYETAGAA